MYLYLPGPPKQLRAPNPRAINIIGALAHTRHAWTPRYYNRVAYVRKYTHTHAHGYTYIMALSIGFLRALLFAFSARAHALNEPNAILWHELGHGRKSRISRMYVYADI